MAIIIEITSLMREVVVSIVRRHGYSSARQKHLTTWRRRNRTWRRGASSASELTLRIIGWPEPACIEIVKRWLAECCLIIIMPSGRLNVLQCQKLFVLAK